MKQLILDKFLFLFNNFKGRRGLYLTFLVLPAVFFVPLWQFVVSFFVGRIIESIYIATYHEYHVHKLLKPRSEFIEFLGYWRLVSGEIQSPFDKVSYHWKHHEFFDTEKDPTQSKLDLASNPILYCLDMTPPGAWHNVDPDRIKIVDTRLYRFFQKYWAHVFLLNIILWVTLTSFWTFVVWFIFPSWAWLCVWKTIDWRTHKLKRKDANWQVLLYGSQCFHQWHHDTYHDSSNSPAELFYGPGIWKWLNIDFYVQKLTFKQIKE